MDKGASQATGLGGPEGLATHAGVHPTDAIPSAVVTNILHGSVRHGGRSGKHGHPADGMTAHVNHGGGAVSTIIDPRSFEDGGAEWVMRYGDPESIRFTVASLLSSYDYLLSDWITQREAIKRLMLMRRARAAIAMAPKAETACPAPVPQDCQARPSPEQHRLSPSQPSKG